MKPIRKAAIVGILTVAIYLGVVVATTPALEPLAAISAAFQLNSIVIFGMGIGIGLQVFLSEKSKQLGCKLDVKRKHLEETLAVLLLLRFSRFFHLSDWDAVGGGSMHCHYFQVWLGRCIRSTN